jgi:hypothetical protein
MAELGHFAPRSRFVHLYVNGSYRGLYGVMELPETPFLVTVPGTVTPQFDVRQGADQLAGDPVSWNGLFGQTGSRTAAPATYEKLSREIDMESFIDFIIVQLFTGNANLNRDGNWMAVRARSPEGPFNFVTTMSPNPMSDWTADQIGFDDNLGPMRLFQMLRQDTRFRERFTVRAGELLERGGALSEELAADRFQSLAKQIRNAAEVESRRWNGEGLDGLETFLKKRPGEFKKQLESAGLWK